MFTTPFYHPKSKPFVDHIFHFGIADNRIWFRNYQVWYLIIVGIISERQVIVLLSVHIPFIIVDTVCY